MKPKAMEDKWFICFEDTLNFHRSWTGLKVYQVIFETIDDKAKIISTFVNIDPKYYTPQSNAREVKVINFHIDCFLPGKAVPLP